MEIFGMSSATRKFHNDHCLGAAITLAYVTLFWLGGHVNLCGKSCIPGEIRNLLRLLEFTRVHVERHILILETKMECRTRCLHDEISGRKGV